MTTTKLDEIEKQRQTSIFQINLLYKVVNFESKTGRNNRCHCGSGVKFKHCCLLEHQKKTEKLYDLIDDLKKLDKDYIKLIKENEQGKEKKN